MQNELRREKDETNLISCGRIAAALAIGIGLVIYFFGPVIAKAVASSTDTQVKVVYYTGKPTGLESYADAYDAHDTNVELVTYTTKSLGRLQWGEQNADGEYDVYYDAQDVHMLAAELNQSWENYSAMYDKYVDAYKAVMQ